MRRQDLPGAFWPSEQQELLLRSAVLDPSRAVEAWNELRPFFDFDRLPWESLVLVPLIYRNLRSLEVSDPLLPRMKGVYRLTWYQNQLRFRQTERVLGWFDDAGIEHVLLKGVPIVLRYYGDAGLRRMEDFDILVPESQATGAMQLLEERQWKRSGQGRKWTHQELLRRLPALNFRDSEDNDCDIHWQLMTEFVVPEQRAALTKEVWDSATPITVGDARSRGLSATDELLNVCAHGARWGSEATVRWVADVATIVTKAGSNIEWQKLIERARERHLTLMLRDAMTYVAKTLDVGIPEEVLAHLSQISVTRREAFAHKAAGRELRRWRFIGDLPHTLSTYAAQSADWGPVRALMRFPRYLQQIWELDNAWQVPEKATSKALRGISRGITGRSRKA